MRRSALAFALVLASLAVIWSFATGAQVIDSDPCRKACYEQKQACVTTCGEHTDPVECEADCDDQLEDCLASCG